MDPSILPEVTSALAANAARNAVISDDSCSGGCVVAVADVSVVVDATVVAGATAMVVVAGSLPSTATFVGEELPSAHAETTNTRMAVIVTKRRVIGNPFIVSVRDKTQTCHRPDRGFT
jgi:hypothetical protein